MTPDPRARQEVRAVIAAAIGTAIEWYDFFLYGLAAALVFPKLFFPASDPFTGALLAFGTYFVGFVARPVGAAIFGHWGDRLGRKASLVATLLLMGLATLAVGLVPTYAAIGIWGGVLLTLLRVVQGIGVGGEWGGSVLLAMEWSQGPKRGFIASWPQFGAPLGLLLANAAIAAFSGLSGDAFLSWGWRVPFLLSFVLVIIGLLIRLGIEETPVFRELKRADKLPQAPVREVLQSHGKEVVLTALLRTSQQSVFYLFTTFVLTYGTGVLKLERGPLLTDVLVASAIALFTVPLSGALSDRIGRKRMTLIGQGALLVWIFVYFQLLDSGVPAFVFLAIALALPIHDLQYGPQAAFIAESFPARVRYSGASLGYQLASITAGGPAPIIALWLLQRFGSSTAIAVYVAATVLVSMGAALALPDRTKDALDAEAEGAPGLPGAAERA